MERELNKVICSIKGSLNCFFFFCSLIFLSFDYSREAWNQFIILNENNCFRHFCMNETGQNGKSNFNGKLQFDRRNWCEIAALLSRMHFARNSITYHALLSLMHYISRWGKFSIILRFKPLVHGKRILQSAIHYPALSEILFHSGNYLIALEILCNCCLMKVLKKSLLKHVNCSLYTWVVSHKSAIKESMKDVNSNFMQITLIN